MDKLTKSLPYNWVITTLGEIRSDLSISINPNKFPKEKFVLYSVPSFVNGAPEIILGEHIGSNKQKIDEDTVLLCKINPRINRVWIVKTYEDLKTIASTEWIPFFKIDGLDPKFLCCYLQNYNFRDFLAANVSGVGGSLMRVKPNTIRIYPFPIAPCSEQHQIVSKIEELFSELDNGIENLKKARAQLKTYRQAVLKYAFEGKLTEQWRAEQIKKGNPPEPAEKLLERIKNEREKHYQQQVADWKKACEQAEAEGKKKPAKPKKPRDLPSLTEKELAELPELPEAWCWGRFENVVIDSQNGLAKRNSKEGTPYKVLRLADINNGNINDQSPRRILLTDCEIYKYTLSKNDFVCIRVNGSTDLVGRMILVPNYDDWAFCDHFIKFCLFKKSIDFKFIRLLFDIQTIRRFINLNMVSSAGQNTVSQTTILSVPIPFCSNAEQTHIVSEIETRLSVCDKLEQTIDDSLKKSEALRQSILKKAFSGELTKNWREKHPELVSGEHSAQKLLERIKAEKAKAEAELKKTRSTRSKKKKVK